MKVKKLVKHLKHNINIRFYKENKDEIFAQCDSVYLMRNYPRDHDSYMLMNYKIKSFEPSHFKASGIDVLNIILEDDNE